MLELSVQAPKLVCDHCDGEMTIMGRVRFSQIGFPCPHCGEPILTAADYVSIKVIQALRRWRLVAR